LTQVFADLALLQRPWWKLCRQAGIFFFREHILVNFARTERSLNMKGEVFREYLSRERFWPVEIGQRLQAVLKRIVDDPIENWILLAIPSRGQDADKLRTLLAFMKCNPIQDFDELDLETFTKPSQRDGWAIEHREIATFEPREADLDWPEIRANPGIFYQKLIRPEVVSTAQQTWLFRNPDDG
jgi:hypothetical protein